MSADQPQQGSLLLVCRACDSPTRREVLTAFGARCGRCHAAWQFAGHPWPGRVPASVDAGPDGTRWARRLRWRQQQGAQLTAAQNDAWRQALRATTTTTDEGMPHGQ